MKNILYIVFTLATVQLVAQSIPQGFNYQGVARDADNNPFTSQDIALEISLISDINGNRVYAETHNVETSELGIFNVVIGEGVAVQGDFTTIDWGADQYLLRTRIDPDGGTDWITVGRSRLWSVPYALYAANGGGGGSGEPINIRGTVGTSAALPTTGSLGELWIAGDTGNGWVWDDTSSSWRDIGQFRGPRGQDGADGRDGIDGQDGQDGQDGTSIRIAGTVATQGDLDNNYSGSVGDLIITLDTGDGYVWNGSSFDFIGEIRGPKGEDGVDGQDGRDGIDGQDGADGRDGVDGRDGIDGQDGTSVRIVGTVATQGALDNNYNGAVGDLIITLDTGDGYVWNGSSWDFIGEIKGPKGDQGDKGDTGDTGSAGATGPRGMDGFTQGWEYTSGQPSSGNFTANTSILSDITSITIHERSSEGNTVDTWLSTYGQGDQVYLRKDDNVNTFALYSITAATTSGSTRNFVVSYIDGAGSLAIDTFFIGFDRSGPRGEQGQQGQNGANGTNGRDGVDGTNGQDGEDGDDRWTLSGNDIFNNNSGDVRVANVTFDGNSITTQPGFPINLNGISFPSGGIGSPVVFPFGVRVGFHNGATNGDLRLSPSNDIEGFANGQWRSLTQSGGGLSGTGTVNRIPKYSSPTTFTNSIMREINSEIRIEGQLSLSNGGEIADIFVNSSGQLVLDPVNSSTTVSSVTIDDDNGNVGIGTSPSSNRKLRVTGDVDVDGDLYLGSVEKIFDGGNNTVGINANFVPETNGDRDLGTSANRWNDLFISGSLSFGSVESLSDGGNNTIQSNSNIVPETSNSRLLGSSSRRWSGVWASGGFISSSDMRLKTQIRPIENSLKSVMKLEPKRYAWKEQTLNLTDDIGFLAQDLLKVFPEVVVTHEPITNDDGEVKLKPVESLGVRYHALIPILTAAIQEQQVIIDSQAEQISTLQSDVADLKRLVQQLIEEQE